MTTPRFGQYDPAELSSAEVFWRNHYKFLKDRGYTLRKRYDPDYSSWINTSEDWSDCEDVIHTPNNQVLDATRADGYLVVIKRVDTEDELSVINHISSEPFASNPRNHCVPILEVISPPEGSHTAFIVMPYLLKVDFPPVETIRDAILFFKQIFEGLYHLHENHIIHGDCTFNNIMADTGCLFDSPSHLPKKYMKRDFGGRLSKQTSRTLRSGVKYYLIDFGLSKLCGPEDVPFLRQGPWGGDKTVPEHLVPNAPPCDPFAVDVYCLGNYLRRLFLDGWDGLVRPPQGFEFMRELLTDMVNKDPTKRPTMSEVISRLGTIVWNLGDKKLRSPVIPRDRRYDSSRRHSLE